MWLFPLICNNIQNEQFKHESKLPSSSGTRASRTSEQFNLDIKLDIFFGTSFRPVSSEKEHERVIYMFCWKCHRSVGTDFYRFPNHMLNHILWLIINDLIRKIRMKKISRIWSQREKIWAATAWRKFNFMTKLRHKSTRPVFISIFHR